MLLLSGAAGLIGTWIVLRGLAFYAHAIAAAAFPGLVARRRPRLRRRSLGALGAAGVFAFAVAGLARSRRDEYASFTALVLVGALALGVILASDVFHSGANVETLLFGSLLLIDRTDLVVAAAATVAALLATIVLGRRWLATGFDPGDGARARRSLGGARGGAARPRRRRGRGVARRARRAARVGALRHPRGDGAALDAHAAPLATRVGGARRGRRDARPLARVRGERAARARRSR